MLVFDLLRLIRFLRMTTAFPQLPMAAARILVESNHRTSHGDEFDIYQPAGSWRGTVIAIHGVTINGKAHHRLVHFARCLAASGIRCVVPQLPGLAEVRFDSGDASALARVIDEVAAADHRQVGIIGFSFGGSLALLAAARPDSAPHVRSILAIGAYASFADVVRNWIAGSTEPPPREGAVDDWLYLRLLLAHRQRHKLALSCEVESRLVELLTRYCDDAGVGEKLAFFRSYLADKDLFAYDLIECNPAIDQALSPIHQLADLACPVALLHDPADTLVRQDQGQRLFEALQREAPGFAHRLVVTSLISHVRASPTPQLGDAFRLLQVIRPFLG